MMNVDEIEIEIKKQKEALASLEVLYDKEEDENKIAKLEFRMSAKEEAINNLIERQEKLLDREAKDEEKEDPKDKNAEEEDLDVCPNCGGDLFMIGVDDNNVPVYECEKCKELYLDE